jgi:hypothetical protein
MQVNAPQLLRHVHIPQPIFLSFEGANLWISVLKVFILSLLNICQNSDESLNISQFLLPTLVPCLH